MKTFAEFVTEWMAGRRDEDVAPAFGVVRTCVRGWRLGEHLLPRSKITKFAAVFGITPQHLTRIIRNTRRMRREERRLVRA